MYHLVVWTHFNFCTIPSGSPFLPSRVYSLTTFALLSYYYHCYYYYYFQQMVSHWSLSDSKSPQVSWTLLSILIDLNNAIVWMLSPRSLISKSSSPCTNPLQTVSSAPITNGITVTFMFNSFFQFYLKVQVLNDSFRFPSLLSYDQQKRQSSLFGRFVCLFFFVLLFCFVVFVLFCFLFLLTISRSGRLAVIK